MRFVFIFSCLLYLFCDAQLQAQSARNYPKVIPSYSEDFSDYKSYPSMCIEDAYYDDNGKLWLSTCGSTSQINLHLFQFDGYEFRPVQKPFAGLNYQVRIIGMVDGHQMIGLTENEGKNQLFILDLNTDLLTPLTMPEQGKVGSIYMNKNEELFFTFYRENELSCYVYADAQFKLLKSFQESAITSSQAHAKPGYIHFDGAFLWFYYGKEGYFERISIMDAQREQFLVSNTNVRGQSNDYLYNPQFGIKDIKTIAGETYFIIEFSDQGTQLLQLNEKAQRIQHVEGTPTDQMSIIVNQDERGNTLFVFRSKKRRFRAYLEDRFGQRFNYSAFFQDLSGPTPQKVIGKDFTRQLLVCSGRGIILHKVKVSNAIRSPLPTISMRSMIELPDHRIFVTSQGDRRFILDSSTGTYKELEKTECFLQYPRLLKNHDGKIWGIGEPRSDTTGSELLLYDGLTNTCDHYTIGVDMVGLFEFLEEGKTIVFVYQDGKLGFFNLKSGKTELFEIDGEVFKFPAFVHDILIDKKGLLWAATTAGLYQINLETRDMKIFGAQPPFLDSRFLCALEDKQGRIWAGTPLGGLHIFDPETHELQILNSENGLGNNTVANITMDDKGRYWLGTYNGISLVSADGTLITNFYEEDGVAHRESNRYSNYKASDGKLYLGSVHGVSVIDPAKIDENLDRLRSLQIYLTNLEYHDSNTGRDTLRRYGLKDAGPIVLPATHRHLNLSFATSNYFKPRENKFAYMFAGEDEDWIDLGNQQTLKLKNLPAGRHRLLIKGGDGVGNWGKDYISLRIDAQEHFYKQLWFYALCVLLSVGIAFTWIYRLRAAVKRATVRIRKDKEIIAAQAEQLQELNEAKGHFFTNISHEFRTPLTIISGMARQIVQSPKLWAERGGQMILRNSNNLLHLVNQIMDLKKLESSKLEINFVQGDAIKYLRYLAESYQTFAANKNIQLHFLATQSSLVMDYDPDKLMKIVSNLLSNAIKFTPENGHVYLQMDQEKTDQQSFLTIRVADTGAGIPASKLPHIFDRFYQVEELIKQNKKATAKAEKMGTGVGLSLTKELVELLNGEISVSSEVGNGAIFFVKLPVTNNSPVESITEPFTASAVVDPRPNIPEIPVETENPVLEIFDSTLPKVLVVEDNPDMQQYIKACLDQSYAVVLAHDGQEGIDKAIEQIPDLVVSDVMMPQKDGYELCEALKNDERTNHIPIILLTAKADFDSKISGLQTGADAYMTKPFEPEELLLRLRNFGDLQKRMQEQFLANGQNLDSVEDVREAIKDPLLQKIYDQTMLHLSDAEFNMARLSRALGMSRSQIFRKVKALTGQPPTTLIRSIRLQKAKQLLLSEEQTVSEIAYDTGFTSLSYFSTAFYEEFGIRPSAIRK